jgi:hypothetical protein
MTPLPRNPGSIRSGVAAPFLLTPADHVPGFT